MTLSVTNDGDRVLPDLRFADDVPAGLRVVEGTPRHTTALRPGKTATVAYEVEAVRGGHEFEGLTVVTRDVSAASRRVVRLGDPSTTVTCRPTYGEASFALGDRSTRLPGREPVSATGSGVAFHSLREYRRGDPLGRLDWSHLAKTGDLAARRYDEPRTVQVVLLVDARRAAYVAPDDRRRPAVDVCAHAAGALATGLLDGGARVGLAALAPATLWVHPGGGGAHRDRLLDRLTTHAAVDWDPPAAADGGGTRSRPGAVVGAPAPDRGIEERVRRPPAGTGTAGDGAGGGDAGRTRSGGRSDGGHVRPESGPVRPDSGSAAVGGGAGSTPPRAGVEGAGSSSTSRTAARSRLAALLPRLPSDAQVVFCSPLSDEVAPAVARRLDALGRDVAVVSPDVTGTETPARRLAALERRSRVDRLRRRGIEVREWTPSGDPTTGAGWSA